MTIRGEDGEVVSSFTVPVGVDIRAWDQDGVIVYDWITDANDSDELYETIEEAATAARDSLGG